MSSTDCEPEVAVPLPAPRWIAPVFFLLAAVLLPWTVYLGFSLPDRVVSRHWDVAWVGFDVALLLALLATGWTAYRRSTWLVSAATAAATLVLCDAWFDVLTSHGGELAAALAEAALVELPLAGLCLYIARHAERVNNRTALLLAQMAQRGNRLPGRRMPSDLKGR